MIPITNAVKHIIIINVLLFLATYTFWYDQRLILAFFYPTSDYFYPWQIITHMFMHGNPEHLIFNMLALYFLGPLLENFLGTRKFVQFYFFSGLGGLLVHFFYQYFSLNFFGNLYILNIPVLGASGAINGLFIGLAYLFPNLEMGMLFLPMTVKAKYLAIVFILSDFIWGVTGYGTGIAHFAHLGGALFGFLFIYFWVKPNNHNSYF